MGICSSLPQESDELRTLEKKLTRVDVIRRKLPKFRRLSSVKRFQRGLEAGAASFNPNLSLSVAMDGNKIGWHHGPHCMNCYLGQEHECWDPKYAKDMDNILRRVFFVKNAHLGGFELSKKKTGKGNDYAVITYIVRYAPETPELPHHNHPHGEEYFVLRGSFDDHSQLGYMPAPAMTYVKYPHGTHHHAQPNVEDGCDVLTWWGQNNNAELAVEQPWWSQTHPDTSANTVQRCDTTFRPPGQKGSAWKKSRHGVGFELELFRAAGPSGERTWMLHVPKEDEKAVEEEGRPATAASVGLVPKPGRAIYRVHAGGLEAYVVRGSFEMDGIVFGQGYWLREAPDAEGKHDGISIKPEPGTYVLMKANHLKHLS
jgi:hypothetical protein